ncbi:MAG: PDZ domain-containing protein [Gemmatimonadetes bacterium]|nr:PDZ domain-containing protein [Gemmatimonadota bacterium]
MTVNTPFPRLFRALLVGLLTVGAQGVAGQEPPPVRPWLGARLDLQYTAAPRPGQEAFHLIVHEVHGGGPAQAGGMRPGDHIIAVDGSRVTYGAWMRSYSQLRPGDQLNVQVRRGDGELHDLVVVAQARPDSLGRGTVAETVAIARSRFFLTVDSLLVVVTDNLSSGGASQTVRVRIEGTRGPAPDSLLRLEEALRTRLRSARGLPSAPRLLRATEEAAALPQVMAPWIAGDTYIFGGAQARTVDERIAALLGSTGSGALITTVLPGSPAAEAGFRPGDMIRAVGSRAIPSAESLRQVLSVVRTPFRVTVVRQGESVVLRFPEEER